MKMRHVVAESEPAFEVSREWRARQGQAILSRLLSFKFYTATVRAGVASVALFAAACGADAKSGAGSMTTNAASTPPACVEAEVGLSGTYSVPVPAELMPYANYDVRDIGFCQRQGQAKLDYNLPSLLVGSEVSLGFTGPVAGAGPLHLMGSHGSADCSQTGTTWTCHEVLSGINGDTQRVSDQLSAVSSTEAQARLDVTTRFLQDPIGTVSFEAP